MNVTSLPFPVPAVRAPVSLRRLFPRCSFVGCADIRVTQATQRSGDVTPHCLFAAVPGTQCDGAQFIGDALERGAAALLVQRPVADVSVPQCVVPNVRSAFAELTAALSGHPSRRLTLVGVTGTNGKTTVTWLLRSIFQAAGKQTGLLGTVGYSDGIDTSPAPLTTPDTTTLSRWLAEMVARRTTHAAIEISSHALHQDRCAGTQLDAAVITNVTHDHLDYHGDYASYWSSKTRMARHCRRGGCLVLNADDPGSASVAKCLGDLPPVVTFGLDAPADVFATILHESRTGTRFLLHAAGAPTTVTTPLIGRHNVSNCLAAAAVAVHLGIPWEAIRIGIEALSAVPGRLERIDCGQPFDVFVDYAHTPDALRNVVTCLRKLTTGRVICVFGAGGDRDRTKRPLLGRAAAGAHLAVVTSDNPRTENSQHIIDDILPGLVSTPCRTTVEPDRLRAIQWAVEHAEPGDCVLVAGKGHETEQIIGTERIPFDDRNVLRSLFAAETQSRDHAEPIRIPA